MRMDDFERLLDLELHRMLDPIVATPAPRRRRSGGSALRAIAGGLSNVAAEVPVFAEPAPVTIVVPAAPIS